MWEGMNFTVYILGWGGGGGCFELKFQDVCVIFQMVHNVKPWIYLFAALTFSIFHWGFQIRLTTL